MNALGGLIVGLVALPLLAGAAERWAIQLFHDQDKSSLILNDITFVTPNRGVAIGVVVEDGEDQATTLITSDGGANWTYVKAPDVGHSIYCLDESACWMAARSGVWFSGEGGRDWRRILKKNGVARVHFMSRERGWAVGIDKLLLETRNGGKDWTPMPVRQQVKTRDDRTGFYAIGFMRNKFGMIAGRSEPPSDRNDRVPLWMDDEPEKRRETPALSVFLETRDAGETWTAGASSMFGRVAQLATADDGRVLALFEFDKYFQFASEVYSIDTRGGKTERTFRSKDVAVTDVALVNSGPALAVGHEVTGSLAAAPIPGKLRVLRSLNLRDWSAMEVDYRASARRAAIFALDSEHVWIATDTGMILRLVRD
jgi:photosystem II stability/assembly factor-like uncharacterized protein